MLMSCRTSSYLSSIDKGSPPSNHRGLPDSRSPAANRAVHGGRLPLLAAERLDAALQIHFEQAQFLDARVRRRRGLPLQPVNLLLEGCALAVIPEQAQRPDALIGFGWTGRI